MDIIGNRKFVEVPGGKTHELPPLLVNAFPRVKRLGGVIEKAAGMVEIEESTPGSGLPMSDLDRSRRKMDIAVNLVDRYCTYIEHWRWGDSILEWIRQCEMTFEARLELRHLLSTNIWPHAGRSSFVQLLIDQAYDRPNLQLTEAVGLRIAHPKPLPIQCCSPDLLIYLRPIIGEAAYRGWVEQTPGPISSLPPERFYLNVLDLALQ